MENKEFRIIKKVAKHGKQAVIIIPAILNDKLKPGTLTQISIEIVKI